ncbi:MAG: hydantoinase/oxoprolinase family protein, partial [Gammaproteobacteria bacterium]
VVNRPGGVYLDNFVLRVTVPVAKPPIPEFPLQGQDPEMARTGTRDAYWMELKSAAPTPIYRFEKLQPGNALFGPAVVEAELTTVVVPPGRKFSIDKHGLGILERDPDNHEINR